MLSVNSVIIVDDNSVNRTMLRKILEDKYSIIEAANGQEALKLLESNRRSVAAVLLDLAMPVMDGYAFLEELSSSEQNRELPVIVLTASNDRESEIRALRLGAWDYVTKPYNSELISFRLSMAIERSQYSELRRLKIASDYDELTAVFSRRKFLAEAEKLLKENPETSFAFIRFDINRFSIINAAFGISYGDGLLKRIGKELISVCGKTELTVFGRMQNDVFCICTPNAHNKPSIFVDILHKRIAEYNSDYTVSASFGTCFTENNDLDINLIFDRANFAARSIKDSGGIYSAVYDSELHEKSLAEQRVLKEMHSALENDMFEIYIQPKYDLSTMRPAGGEALVRWRRPDGTVLLPKDFIPVLEQNGLITQIDRRVLEKTCRTIRHWMDKGVKLYPVSVNMSRANIYNRNIVEELTAVVDSYSVPHKYLNIELTESLYSEEPQAVQKVVQALRERGFVVMMDDFGSAYSSLGILKDMTVDVLKIDMRFLSECADIGRARNIIASVVRMSRWLGIQVIAEGAETENQVNFLRGIGCDYVQGYFFDKPMPVEAYEQKNSVLSGADETAAQQKALNISRGLFAAGMKSDSIFANIVDAAAVYEFDGEHLEILRVNNNFYELVGGSDNAVKLRDLSEIIDARDRDSVMDICKRASESGEILSCLYRRRLSDGKLHRMRIRLRRIEKNGNNCLLYGVVADISGFYELVRQWQELFPENESAILRWSFFDDKLYSYSGDIPESLRNGSFSQCIMNAVSGGEFTGEKLSGILSELKGGKTVNSLELPLLLEDKKLSYLVSAVPFDDNAIILCRKI